MPKRARCPYCDCLLDRKSLDDHVSRCRFRETPSHQTMRSSRRLLVLDGNNIAFYLAPDGTPRSENLVRAVRSLSASGYKPIVMISAALKHKIDRPDMLETLVAETLVLEAPSGTDDDLFIIKEAMKRDGDIVSNDRFLNWLHRYPWIPSRLRRYRMTESGLILS